MCSMYLSSQSTSVTVLTGPPPAELLFGKLEYEVAAVLQHQDTPRCVLGKFTRQYLVMWRGSDSGHNMWGPARNLMSAAHKVREYWEQQGSTQIPKKIILNTQMPTMLLQGLTLLSMPYMP